MIQFGISSNGISKHKLDMFISLLFHGLWVNEPSSVWDSESSFHNEGNCKSSPCGCVFWDELAGWWLDWIASRIECSWRVSRACGCSDAAWSCSFEWRPCRSADRCEVAPLSGFAGEPWARSCTRTSDRTANSSEASCPCGSANEPWGRMLSQTFSHIGCNGGIFLHGFVQTSHVCPGRNALGIVHGWLLSRLDKHQCENRGQNSLNQDNFVHFLVGQMNVTSLVC